MRDGFICHHFLREWKSQENTRIPISVIPFNTTSHCRATHSPHTNKRIKPTQLVKTENSFWPQRNRAATVWCKPGNGHTNQRQNLVTYSTVNMKQNEEESFREKKSKLVFIRKTKGKQEVLSRFGRLDTCKQHWKSGPPWNRTAGTLNRYIYSSMEQQLSWSGVTLPSSNMLSFRD